MRLILYKSKAFPVFSRVTSSEGAPIILKVKGIKEKDLNFSVDLVPSFKLDISDPAIACPDLHKRIKTMIETHNISNSQVDNMEIFKAVITYL